MSASYLIRRLLILLPTLLGITMICFVLIQTAPGGPIQQRIREMKFGAGAMNDGSVASSGISDEVLESLKLQYGFDKPLLTRYVIWLKNIVTLDFGESYNYEMPAIEVILSKVPVSLQFGIISLLLTYLICIPLGVLKAVYQGTRFDVISTFILTVMYSIPSFMLAILLITYFAGDTFLSIFPIGGLYSDDYQDLSWWDQLLDRIHHLVLPMICYLIGSFTSMTILMKNSLLEEIKKDYIRTARAKGLSEKVVMLKHGLRNALIPLATGFGGFLSIFVAGSLLLETIFQIDGMGLLSYQSVLERDYNVLMGLIFIQSLFLVLGNLISDFSYYLVDPRVKLE